MAKKGTIKGKSKRDLPPWCASSEGARLAAKLVELRQALRLSSGRGHEYLRARDPQVKGTIRRVRILRPTYLRARALRIAHTWWSWNVFSAAQQYMAAPAACLLLYYMAAPYGSTIWQHHMAALAVSDILRPGGCSRQACSAAAATAVAASSAISGSADQRSEQERQGQHTGNRLQHDWDKPAPGTGPSTCLGQARSRDRPLNMHGTSPLLGQALGHAWDKPDLGTGP